MVLCAVELPVLNIVCWWWWCRWRIMLHCVWTQLDMAAGSLTGTHTHNILVYISTFGPYSKSFDSETKSHKPHEPKSAHHIKLHEWILNRLRILNSNKFIYQWPLSVSELYTILGCFADGVLVVSVCARPGPIHIRAFYILYILICFTFVSLDFACGRRSRDGRHNNQIFWICIFGCRANNIFPAHRIETILQFAERILWFSSNALMFYISLASSLF